MTLEPRASRVRWWLPGVVFLTLFVAGRLWFFVDFPIAVIHPDSGSYFVVSEAIQNGGPAHFGDRSPLYPMLMAAVFSVVDRVMALVIVQSILACLAGLAMTYAVFALQPILSLPVAVALGAYFMDADALEHDTAVLTESLYTSLLLLSFAALAWCFSSRRPAWPAAASSVGMALVIYTKPGGIYLVVIYAMVLAYFLWRRVRWPALAAFAVPFPVLLLLLAGYNYRTIDVFALSASDATEVSLITNFYWEPDPSYPPEINDAIGRVAALTASRNTPEELQILNESWDFARLYDLYLRGHYYGPISEIAKATPSGNRAEHRRWVLRISMDAIARHPDRFFKHFVVMIYYYYRSIFYNTDFRQYLYNRVHLFYLQKHFSRDRGLPEMARWGKEFADPVALPPAIRITDYDLTRPMDLNQRIVLEDTWLTKIYLWLRPAMSRLFSTVWWSFGQIVVFAFVLAAFVRARLRHDAAFLLLVLACAPLGNGMIVSLVEYSQPRYSYPLEWAYYVTFLCLPLLLVGRDLLPRRAA
jgi:hypothetical protein